MDTVINNFFALVSYKQPNITTLVPKVTDDHSVCLFYVLYVEMMLAININLVAYFTILLQEIRRSSKYIMSLVACLLIFCFI